MDDFRQQLETEFPEGEPLITFPRLGVILYPTQCKLMTYVAACSLVLGIGLGLLLGDGLQRRQEHFEQLDLQQQNTQQEPQQ